MRRGFFIGVALILAIFAFMQSGSLFGPSTTLTLVSGSENKALEPIIERWGSDNGVDVQVTYLGSVDISREIAKGQANPYDAVWPANSIWIELGDTEKTVKHAASILRSPVVLGLKRSIAEDLGWTGRDDITIQMIQNAARDDAFRLAMTSATQSNSGASAYIGFLYALAGDPDLLTMDHLRDASVLDGVRDLLSQVDRSSGSSGWLGESVAGNPGAFDAMMNYEAVVLETNAALTAAGEEPLYIIYPANGLSVADSPLGYVSKGDQEKEDAFLALQEHLLSAETQAELSALGRRAGLIGLDASNADTRVWNPDWGVDLARSIAPVPVPASDVIQEALRLYQTELRKPSLTIWVLDVSGSMQGEPIEQLKDAMTLLLDPEKAAINLLQPSARDITVIVPFNIRTGDPLIVEGSDPAKLDKALAYVKRLRAGGGTDLYGAIVKAMEALEPYNEDGTLFDYLPAIVAMTDGASETNNRALMLDIMGRNGFGKDIPIHAIAFGDADEAQLKELNDATIGRLFTAGDDLAGALRKAKGYN